jgi:hypothetical protein
MCVCCLCVLLLLVRCSVRLLARQRLTDHDDLASSCLPAAAAPAATAAGACLVQQGESTPGFSSRECRSCR